MKHLKKYNESIFDKLIRSDVKIIIDKIKDSFLYITDEFNCEFSNINYAHILYSYTIDCKLFRSDNIDKFLELLNESIDKCKFELDVEITSFIFLSDRNMPLLGDDDKLNILKAFVNNRNNDHINIRIVIK